MCMWAVLRAVTGPWFVCRWQAWAVRPTFFVPRAGLRWPMGTGRTQ